MAIGALCNIFQQ